MTFRFSKSGKKLLGEARIEELRRRRAELQPLVEEAEEIDRLLRAWEDLKSPEPRPWRRTPRPRKAYPVAVRREQILGLLGESPEITRAEIARRLDLTPARAGQLVNELVQEGKIVDRRGQLSNP